MPAAMTMVREGYSPAEGSIRWGFPPSRRSGTLPAMPLHQLLLLATVLPLTACQAAGRFLEEILRERPPVALDSLAVASDGRIDSAGNLLGSFVGEGTSRSIHLLSSDTGLIAGMLRRYRPDLAATPDPWATLSRRRIVVLGSESGRRPEESLPLSQTAVVGSELGHTDITLAAILLRGGRCGWRGAQAEIIVEDRRRAGDPPLRGPVLGSFRDGAASRRGSGMVRREPLPSPSGELVTQLVTRTAAAMDSSLTEGFRSLGLRPLTGAETEINTLADVDAADVVPFRVTAEAVRYAVSLRSRRVSIRGDTMVGAIVMVWDSAAAWRQVIFQPTVLSLARGRLGPYRSRPRALYWRRLQPMSDFGFRRDNLWLEQVDVRDGTTRWGVIQPRGNVIVAAAEVDGPCR